MEQVVLVAFLILLTVNLLVGLWYAFSWDVPIVPTKRVLPTPKAPVQEDIVWAPGWTSRAGPPPSAVDVALTEAAPDAYVPSEGYSFFSDAV